MLKRKFAPFLEGLIGQIRKGQGHAPIRAAGDRHTDAGLGSPS